MSTPTTSTWIAVSSSPAPTDVWWDRDAPFNNADLVSITIGIGLTLLGWRLNRRQGEIIEATAEAQILEKMNVVQNHLVKGWQSHTPGDCKAMLPLFKYASDKLQGECASALDQVLTKLSVSAGANEADGQIYRDIVCAIALYTEKLERRRWRWLPLSKLTRRALNHLLPIENTHGSSGLCGQPAAV